MQCGAPDAVDLLATRFRILSEPLRVRLIQALRGGEKSVTALAADVSASQATVSHHLRLMEAAGVLGRRPEGNLVYYFVADSSVFALCDAVCASIGERLSHLTTLFGPAPAAAAPAPSPAPTSARTATRRRRRTARTP